MTTPIDPHTLNVLEFDRMAQLLISFASSEVGESVSKKIAPLTEPAPIKERLKETSEMKDLLGTTGVLPLGALLDVTSVIQKAVPSDSILAPRELWDILLLVQCSHEVRSFLREDDGKHPALEVRAQKIKPLIDLEKELVRTVDADGGVLDSASPGLKAIREKSRSIRNNIKTALEEILNRPDYAQVIQEKYVTLRHERYVIPVRTDAQSLLPGVVHDQSKKHNTYFVEPLATVELNNELTLCKDEESREEMRILRRLTTVVRENRKALLNNQRHLGILDSIQARARMSIFMKAREPALVADGEVRLLQARHPILLQQAAARNGGEGTKVVPIDITIPRDCSGLVITGANMGGKTAALKTLGLLTLMAQAGMHIPVADGSCVTMWESVFADIGDEQNLDESLSTFSSHIKQLNHIMKYANERSLVLLDELGTGTDPQEGSALVLALLDALRDRKSTVAVTSHLNLLKAYAASLPDVLNVSVGFDSATLQPTFELLYGVPGTSRALETAARLGVASQILDKAKSYLKESNRRILELSEDLQDTAKNMRGLKRDLTEILNKATRYEEIIQTLSRRIESKKEVIFAQVERKGRTLFREAESEVKKIMKSARSHERAVGSNVKGDLNRTKKHLLERLTSKERNKGRLDDLEKGVRLVIGKEGKEGEVVTVDYETNTVEVLLGDMRLKTSIDELEQMKGIRVLRRQAEHGHASNERTTVGESETSSTPLNLIGLTVDEAVPLVDKALDQALLWGKTHIHIIHGIGTGRLREGIHHYLRQKPGIRAFQCGEPGQGGAGITIVELDA